MEPSVRWANRSPREISDQLHGQGHSLCLETVRRILRQELSLGHRQTVKDATTCNYPQRDDQFEYITQLREECAFWGFPVLSIDTKQKELLGDFYRPGHAWTDGRIVAPDHDFRSCATGKLVPYGVYDVHEGLMTLTTSDDTPELACAAVRLRWYRLGKYNAIEHRVFCHVERSLRGVILNSIDTAAWFISRPSCNRSRRRRWEGLAIHHMKSAAILIAENATYSADGEGELASSPASQSSSRSSIS